MTIATAHRSPAPPTARSGLDARAVLAVGAGLGAVALAVAVAGLALDDRTIGGVNAWLKPAKFGISTVAYLLTLRWLVGHLPATRLTRVVAVGVVAALAGELAIIDVQVLRGTTSHFNISSPGDGALWQAMGMLISVVWLLTFALGVRVLRTRGLDAGLAAGLRWGLGVCLLGMAQAFTMISNTGWDEGGGHTVGARDGGPGLPLTGWSTLHGDLRIGHFVGLHALQALPLLAWLLATRTDLSGRTRARLVATAGCSYAGLLALLTWQALRGQALLRPDATTLLALVALGAVTAAGAAAVLRRHR